MPNHYQLLIQTPNANLSRCMRHLNGVYTQRFNRTPHFDGQLFRGRYKSILVDGDSYLLQLVRYIHRNPLRAGLVENIDKYPWSSHQGYVSHSKKRHWLNQDFILSSSVLAPDIRDVALNNASILLVFWSVFGVALRGTDNEYAPHNAS